MRYKNLDKWVIVYNSHQDLFKATKREYYTELSNNNNSSLVIRSKDINTLFEIIEKTDGDRDSMEKLITCS